MFKKVLLSLLFLVIIAPNVFAAKFSPEMKDFIKHEFPNANLRFDGLIAMPDGTLYLPLYPALVKNPTDIEIRETVSVDKNSKYPEIIILNNDFVFMKVIKNVKGQKTLLYQKNPPLEVKTGLLPQDMLVPSGLYIPDNIKGIMGNLEIPTIEDNGLKLEAKHTQKPKQQIAKPKNDVQISVLNNKVIYAISSATKDIQVFKAGKASADYGLVQSGVVYDIKPTPDKKFLLITTHNKQFLDVISLADDMRIKQVDLSAEGGEILVDNQKNKAYIACPKISSLLVLDINTMTLTQKIKLKGYCSKLTLADNNRKLFYCDKKTNEVWSVELDNDFITKYIGTFPNISKIEYANGRVYLLSRVSNRFASIDYSTLNLVSEFGTKEKPVDMLVYKNFLYILSASTNTIQILDTFRDQFVGEIVLGSDGFASQLYRIDNSKYILVTDSLSNNHSVVDLDTNKVVKKYSTDIPVTKVVIVPEIRKN